MKTSLILELKNSGSGGFEGYGSVFYKIDRVGDIVLPGAFRDGLPEFIKNAVMGGVNHNHAAPAGFYTDAWEDDRGLFVKGRFSDVESGREARTLMRDGVIKKLSVGMDREGMVVSKASPEEVKKLWAKAGYEPKQSDLLRLKTFRQFRLIHKAQLREVSPVAFPANDDADILLVKNGQDLPETFRNWVISGRSAYVKLSTIETKSGRVFSSKNEMKLRAMAEVISSVAEELENLLTLVAQSPEIEDEQQEDEEETTGGSGKSSQEPSVDKAKLLNDKSLAKYGKQNQKSCNPDVQKLQLELAMELV